MTNDHLACSHCGRLLDICECGVDQELVYRPGMVWDDDEIGPINGHRKSEALSTGCFTVVAMAFGALVVIGLGSMLLKLVGRI